MAIFYRFNFLLSLPSFLEKYVFYDKGFVLSKDLSSFR